MKTLQTILVLTSLTMGGGIAHGGILSKEFKAKVTLQCISENPVPLCECIVTAMDNVATALNAEVNDLNGDILFPTEAHLMEAFRRMAILEEQCHQSHASSMVK